MHGGRCAGNRHDGLGPRTGLAIGAAPGRSGAVRGAWGRWLSRTNVAGSGCHARMKHGNKTWILPDVPALMGAAAVVCGLLALAGLGLDDARLSRAMLALCVFLAFCAMTLAPHQRRQRARAAILAAAPGDAGQALLLAYASQTGYAEQLAWQTAQTLQAGAMPVRLASLEAIDGNQ